MVSAQFSHSNGHAANGTGYANGYTNGHSNGYSNGHGLGPAIVDPTSAKRDPEPVKVNSAGVDYSDEHITSKYLYNSTSVKVNNGKYQVTPLTKEYTFKTERKVPKVGLMLVGWGGNNGSTLTATVHANRENITWRTKEGLQTPNYIGSMVRASTLKIGTDETTGKDVYIPFSDMLPMVHPNDFVLGGWDISSMPLDQAMHRAKVLDWDLQRQVAPLIAHYKPLPSIYYPTWINANQDERADNIMAGSSKKEHLEQIRKDIREFKANNQLDKVIVLWTANTERYAESVPGVNDTAENLLGAINKSHAEIAPSTLFAVASILEGAPYINGAPQNTFVDGVVALAERERAFIAGDDFKTGQTRVKSSLVEFMVNAGLKPIAIASYNHLGNNDGRNLNAPAQFASKEISKKGVCEDMVESNSTLYKKDEGIEHQIVIKYMKTVGDSKRAIDEYVSEIMMGGRNILSIYNLCEDSLLATPIIFDLAILGELMTRIQYSTDGQNFDNIYPVMSLLSNMLKAPLVKKDTPVINAFSKQRAAVENFMRACIGLQPESSLELDTKITW